MIFNNPKCSKAGREISHRPRRKSRKTDRDGLTDTGCEAAQQSELLVQVEPAQNSSWRTRFCERFLKPQFYRQIPCPVHHVTRSASLKTRSNNETIPTATTRMGTPTLTPSWIDQSITQSTHHADCNLPCCYNPSQDTATTLKTN
ncbi:hypothetical protein M758_12G028200 [Ceratodon purpureus]|nr:hypothetical protein M758_12G028200 [Ceratodon purpureus]